VAGLGLYARIWKLEGILSEIETEKGLTVKKWNMNVNYALWDMRNRHTPLELIT
jgi:hypothetical protein